MEGVLAAIAGRETANTRLRADAEVKIFNVLSNKFNLESIINANHYHLQHYLHYFISK